MSDSMFYGHEQELGLGRRAARYCWCVVGSFLSHAMIHPV